MKPETDPIDVSCGAFIEVLQPSEAAMKAYERAEELERRIVDGTDDADYCAKWARIHRKMADAARIHREMADVS